MAIVWKGLLGVLALVFGLHIWSKFAEGINAGTLYQLYAALVIGIAFATVGDAPNWMVGTGLLLLPVTIWYAVQARRTKES